MRFLWRTTSPAPSREARGAVSPERTRAAQPARRLFLPPGARPQAAQEALPPEKTRAAQPARRRFLPPGAQLGDIALVCLADGIVGVSFGATSVGGGLAWWVPAALSALVFAGGAQIAAVAVVLAGGSPATAVLAGAVLNTRHLPYGLAVADVIGHRGDDGEGARPAADGGQAGDPGGREAARPARRRLRGLRLLAGAHLITDESVAFAMRQSDPRRRRSAFWACGLMLFTSWNAAVLLGVALGSAVRDTSAFGLDATFPAVLLALALPTLTSRPTRAAAGTGAVIAVALTPLLPAGLPLLAALSGLGARWRGWRKRGGR